MAIGDKADPLFLEDKIASFVEIELGNSFIGGAASNGLRAVGESSVIVDKPRIWAMCLERTAVGRREMSREYSRRRFEEVVDIHINISVLTPSRFTGNLHSGIFCTGLASLRHILLTSGRIFIMFVETQ